ncbi:MAG: N-acetylneuraminate synthase family protein [Acidimicrobiales bacterium]
MNATVSIGDRLVGNGCPCYVIAEAGSNHNRDFDMALKLIDAAADAKADAIKFQTFSGSSLYSTKAPKFDYLASVSQKAPHELLEEISLPRDWQPLLAEHCRSRGVEFLSSPFDLEAVDQLVALGVPALKVASFEIVDLPFLREIGSRGRTVIVSTGMASLGEIEEAIESIREGGTADVCLLQCASVYPAPASVINLRTIATMKAAFGVPVGLSDHTRGIHVGAAAVALGANLLEKHFTLSRDLPGPDHSFAIEPDELADLVDHVREVESALGDGRKTGPSDEEALEMYSKARRSVVAAHDNAAGTKITRDMLTVKRPGYGVKPNLIDALVGRVAAREIEADEVITWDML